MSRLKLGSHDANRSLVHTMLMFALPIMAVNLLQLLLQQT